MGRDCTRENKGKNWDEISIKPNEWGDTVRERREGKKLG